MVEEEGLMGVTGRPSRRYHANTEGVNERGKEGGNGGL